MRLRFAASAVHGHAYPSVPLALAAVRAGHEAVFAVGKQFEPQLRSAGLDVVANAMDLTEAMAGAAVADIPADERESHVGRPLEAVMAQRRADDLAAPLSAAHCRALGRPCHRRRAGGRWCT
ncbi:hypothetical protein N8J89_19975 [Crossiella sp. CA-258035]|uniref:hypothetical protein n=1 Tax=Crossiella sp. CA-258035 TaxID=2981138 RepID=UPI0024BD1CAD|nr:hypothetical protein [Crossiella sp. CA-258035]WHT23265.1 hypothetical protein N8J89_19975 [Crossiella sp. CA-258035]